MFYDLTNSSTLCVRKNKKMLKMKTTPDEEDKCIRKYMKSLRESADHCILPDRKTIGKI
jgi:hypothetical protein